MTDELTQTGQEHIQELFQKQQEAVGEMAKEIAEREFELFEFNLFLSASGEEHLRRACNDVQEIRRLEDEGEMDLSQYEDLTNEF